MSPQKLCSAEYKSGFTLIEMLIVVAIIGIIAAIAYPSYQQYIIKTKRADMMSEIHNIANVINAQKLQKGGYDDMSLSGRSLNPVMVNSRPVRFTGSFPSTNPDYNVVVAPISPDWVITATPLASSVNADDGTLTMNARELKCRILSSSNKKCGLRNEWN